MSSIKLSDYVFNFLADAGVRHVFVLTGGGAMHLNDSLGREGRIEYVCHHHEQGCAIAAEGYSRSSGKIGVVSVTTGPGGTNALTGTLGQWLDSVPALYISGQVRYATTAPSTGLPLRQLGDQEADIIPIVRSITKYAVSVTKADTIRYHLEKALYLASSGRPGPVWVDIPLDVQSAMIDPAALAAFDPKTDLIGSERHVAGRLTGNHLDQAVLQALERIRSAKRPVILAGAGIRLANAYPAFREAVEKLGIPVLNAWNAIDALPSDHPLYFGRPSTLGQRAANFIFQNSDLLLNIGCRLNLRQIGYTFEAVARAAYKISVDADPLELQKPTLKIDLPIAADAGDFLTSLNRLIGPARHQAPKEWLSWCEARKRKYPPVPSELHRQAEAEQRPDRVHPYVFCEILSDYLDSNDTLVSSNGGACVIPIQALRIQEGQRHIVNSGCAAMGYGLPAAIGACFGSGKKRTICFEGDGSIQLNLQELQTVVHHRLPVKIFLFNNAGYLSIRSTQNNFFQGRKMGEGPESGVSFPDMAKVAEAYGIPAVVIRKHSELREKIQQVLKTPGPALCDVRVDPDCGFTPRVSSLKLPDGRMVSKPLEDLFPFLEREEFLSNMLIPSWES